MTKDAKEILDKFLKDEEVEGDVEGVEPEDTDKSNRGEEKQYHEKDAKSLANTIPKAVQIGSGAGHPFKYTPKELKHRIDKYFEACEPHIREVPHIIYDDNGEVQEIKRKKIVTRRRPPTFSGMARALGMGLNTLRRYTQGGESDDVYFPIMADAILRIIESTESELFREKGQVAGIIYYLKTYVFKEEEEPESDALKVLDRIVKIAESTRSKSDMTKVIDIN